MQIHQLQPKHKSKKGKRVGRGGKKGTYSGRGIKGQSARAGRKMVPMIRELVKRYPKLKGYRASVLKNPAIIVGLDILEKNFTEGETVNPIAILRKGIVSAPKKGSLKIKILGNGDLKKNLSVEGCKVSKSAKAAIEKAGGSVKI